MTLTLGDRVLLVPNPSGLDVAMGPVYAPESVGDRCVLATDATGQNVAVHCVPADLVLDRCLIVPDASGNLVAVRLPAENEDTIVTGTASVTPPPGPSGPTESPVVPVAVYGDCHAVVPAAVYRSCDSLTTDCANYRAFRMNIYMRHNLQYSTWNAENDAEENPVLMSLWDVIGTEDEPIYIYRGWINDTWKVYFYINPELGYARVFIYDTQPTPWKWYFTTVTGIMCGELGPMIVSENYRQTEQLWTGDIVITGYAPLFNAEIIGWIYDE